MRAQASKYKLFQMIILSGIKQAFHLEICAALAELVGCVLDVDIWIGNIMTR